MLEDLYQELILDHNQHPHHYGKLEDATHYAHGHNPICGDDVQVDLLVKEGVIEDIRFCGEGCAISKSSASVMTDELIGKSVEEARQLFLEFHALLTEENQNSKSFKKAQVFEGVRQFPVRVKCATLPWHTMQAALNRKNQKVTTE